MILICALTNVARIGGMVFPDPSVVLLPSCGVAGKRATLGHTFQGHPLTPLNVTAAVLWSHAKDVLRAGEAVCGCMSPPLMGWGVVASKGRQNLGSRGIAALHKLPVGVL